MRRATFVMPLLALIAGAVGYFIRMMELEHVFDYLTGLPERGSSITSDLIAVSAFFVLICLAFSVFIGVQYKPPKGFENAFGTDPLTYPFAFGVIGVVWFAATVLLFLDLRNMHGTIPLIYIYFCVLSALSAISVAFFAIEMYQEPRRKSVFALSVVPTLFMCFWLVLLYRDNASNPVLLSYAYMCLAIITSALGFYFTSGFVYGKPAPGKTLFFYLTAIYFCFVTIADHQHMMHRVIFAAILAMNVVYSSKLIKNLQQRVA